MIHVVQLCQICPYTSPTWLDVLQDVLETIGEVFFSFSRANFKSYIKHLQRLCGEVSASQLPWPDRNCGWNANEERKVPNRGTLKNNESHRDGEKPERGGKVVYVYLYPDLACWTDRGLTYATLKMKPGLVLTLCSACKPFLSLFMPFCREEASCQEQDKEMAQRRLLNLWNDRSKMFELHKRKNGEGQIIDRRTV